jgi:3-hydroxybutyryl-CoA dehydratase
MEQARPKGLYFEEFTVGQEVESATRTITETDVVLFAGLTGDYNLIHTDAEFAKSTPVGQRVAHGLLGLSIASGLATRIGFMEGTILAFLGLTWKFKGTILFGDTIRMRGKVSKTRAMSSMGGGMVVLEISVLNQQGKVVQEGEWSLLVLGRPQA